MLDSLTTLRFKNHMVGRWVIDRLNFMDTFNQKEKPISFLRAKEVDVPAEGFFIQLEYLCASNNVKEKQE
jgi:hypothetical protein